MGSWPHIDRMCPHNISKRCINLQSKHHEWNGISKPYANVAWRLPTRQTHTVVRDEVRRRSERRRRKKHLCRLWYGIETAGFTSAHVRERKKQPFQHFSRLASGWYPQLNACYAQTHRQTKKLQSMYCRRSRELPHNMGKTGNETNTPCILFDVFLFVDSQTGEPVVNGRLPRQDAGKIWKINLLPAPLKYHTHTEKCSVPMVRYPRTLRRGLFLLASNVINQIYKWLWNKTWHMVLLKAVPG